MWVFPSLYNTIMSNTNPILFLLMLNFYIDIHVELLSLFGDHQLQSHTLHMNASNEKNLEDLFKSVYKIT